MAAGDLMCRCGKVTHLSEDDAIFHVDELKDRLGMAPDVYPCPEGQGFHVGYPKAKAVQLSKKARRKRKAGKRMK